MNELNALEQGIRIAVKNGAFTWEDNVSLKVAFDRVAALVKKGLEAEQDQNPKIPADGKNEPNLKKR